MAGAFSSPMHPPTQHRRDAECGAGPRYPHAPLQERVWELRHELSAHDASYLALAEAVPDGALLTADAALAGRARTSLGSDGVRHVQ